MGDLTPIVTRALELLGVQDAAGPYVSTLRSHISADPMSRHGAAVVAQRVAERTQSKEERERFQSIHGALRAQGARELDRFTLLLQKVGEERSLLELLRLSAPKHRGAVAGAGAGAVAGAFAAGTSGAPNGDGYANGASSGGGRGGEGCASGASPTGAAVYSSWILTRPALSGRHLHAQTVERGVLPPPIEDTSLGSLPVETQESLLVEDLLMLLSGYEPRYLRTQLDPSESDLSGASASRGASASVSASVAMVAAKGVLPKIGVRLGKLTLQPAECGGEGQAIPVGHATAIPPGVDPSLLALSQRLLPLAQQSVQLWQWSHSRGTELSSGLVVHAVCAAVRACLKEHQLGIAQLQRQARAEGLGLQQLFHFLQPSVRMLQTLDDLVSSFAAAGVASARGGALLRLLHDRRRRLAGDAEAAALLDFVLQRAMAPYYGLLSAWLYRGVNLDQYAEFMVRESPQYRKESLVTEFSCAYWHRRFSLDMSQVPAFLEQHAPAILDAGKYLHVIRECGRAPQNPNEGATALEYGTDERTIALTIEAARDWASAQVLELLMGEQRLLARLQSLKHYFLLDQGDFFVHFLDSSEEELVKPVSQISRGRLASTLESSLRQAAVVDDFKSSLSCDLLPYNLTNQLLRIINTAKCATGGTLPPVPQNAEKTPGLDAFTFDYSVGWPLSLVLSKNAIIKYQLLFRHLFHCKHVERQLAASWLSQQSTKGLSRDVGAALTSSYRLRQRMLHFLQNIEHYMMLEVLEPNWHVFRLKLQTASKVDELVSLHNEFLDSSLKECMLRDAVLLKLLATLLTICVIFAEQTKAVMQRIGELMAAELLAPIGVARQRQLAARSAAVRRIVREDRYGGNVQKLGHKFDEELRKLLAELRKQAHKEWNLSHLCARLDYNSYWANSVG